MSTEIPRSDEGRCPMEATSSLGFLLKHAHHDLAKRLDSALAPLSIEKRELSVLMVTSGPDPLSQLEAAQKLWVDRTTMVTLLDGLEAKGMIARHPSAGDRRRNVIELTDHGRTVLAEGVAVRDSVEKEFLDGIDSADEARIRRALESIVARALADED